MRIVVQRHTYTPRSTIGRLLVDGKHICDTLEDFTRPPGEKVYAKTSIPPGAYRVIVTYSPRFKRDLPLLLKVPMFEGIRIHSGNDHTDTEGCILVGTHDPKQADWISASRVAFNKLMPLIEKGVKTPEGVFLVIEDNRPAQSASAPVKLKKGASS